MHNDKNREIAKKNIDKLFDEMNSLEHRFKEANETTKLEYRNLMDDLRIKKKELELEYEKYKKATDDTSKELKSAVEEAREIFRYNLESLKERFKEKDENKDK